MLFLRMFVTLTYLVSLKIEKQTINLFSEHYFIKNSRREENTHLIYHILDLTNVSCDNFPNFSFL